MGISPFIYASVTNTPTPHCRLYAPEDVGEPGVYKKPPLVLHLK